MKIGITGKLIIVLLVTTTLLVAAMAIATRWSFQKGFIDYLTEAELTLPAMESEAKAGNPR